MMVNVRYDVTSDLLDNIHDMQRKLAPKNVNKVVGRAVANQVRESILSYGEAHPNKMGAPSSGYYKGAAKGTSFTSDDNGATVTVTHVGINQRIYGGIIEAKKSKYLTIPVHVKAYNRRARDMELVPIIRRINGQVKMIGLAEPESRGKPGKMMFVLKEKVRQVGDVNIVPTEKEMAKAAHEALDREL
jgi:hypothetical protein